MGWPTPTVMPSDGYTEAVTRAVGVRVVKVDARWAVTPSGRATVASTR